MSTFRFSADAMWLTNRIPQKHIATFLGVAPEFFNTIHARVLRMPG